MIVRNDDVCAGTTLREIRTFCEICDRYGATPLHAITPIGTVRNIDCRWDNARIRREAGTVLFAENREVVEYLCGRTSDLIAVHGLWHTHRPTRAEVVAADELIYETGLIPTYFVPPFNEGCYSETYGRLMVCGAGVPRLEEFLDAGDPGADVTYLHSWRFEYGPFTWTQLDQCLNRLTQP